jgi:penicillin-binding protein 2
MFLRNLFQKKRKGVFNEVAPDEIFLDAKNIPKFNTQQFEGRIEKPIPKNTITLIGGFFVIVLALYAWKAGALSLIHGEEFLKESRDNSLAHEPIFAERGIIYDRTGERLAWNAPARTDEPFSRREYKTPGFSHLLGYVSYPAKDNQGFYWQSEFLGKAAVEKLANDELSGTNGTRLIERDVHGEVYNTNLIAPPIPGKNIKLTIDARVQSEFFSRLKSVAEAGGYSGGAAAVMDISNGELIALTSYPEYDSSILSEGNDTDAIKRYFTDSRSVFINRAISGLYAPGSIVKPFMATAALSEGVVTPETKILSNSQIVIPNPFTPSQPSIFRDYHPNNGWLDVRNALRVSSNIYFFNVIGGYQNQKGIGMTKAAEYLHKFGIAEKTGIDLDGEKVGNIPTPEWKAKVFPKEPWRIGDSYNSAIGQYSFQVTPIEMLRAVAAIANNGTLVTPHIREESSAPTTPLPIPNTYLPVIREGMRLVATSGTAATMGNLPFEVAVKTGTAEVQVAGKYNRVNSWMIGFFPYEAPKYAFVVMLERGPSDAESTVRSVGHDALLEMYQKTPEYVR